MHAPGRKGGVKHFNMALREKLRSSRGQTLAMEVDARSTKRGELVITSREVLLLTRKKLLDVGGVNQGFNPRKLQFQRRRWLQP